MGWTYETINKLSMGYALELLDYWKENPPTHISTFNAWFTRPKPTHFSDVVQHSKLIGLKGRARKAPQYIIDAMKRSREQHARI